MFPNLARPDFKCMNILNLQTEKPVKASIAKLILWSIFVVDKTSEKTKCQWN